MITLLHTADWQIGRQYGRFDPEAAALLANARFEAVERLAALATEHNVAAVLVAGDVFDAQGVADRTIHRLFNAMRGFSGPWVLLPGNHDAALAESVWTRAERLGARPPNVFACTTPEPLVLESAGIVVLPAPLVQRHTHDDLTAWFGAAPTPAGLRRIGLAHGSVEGILAEDIDSPNPIAAGRAEQAGLDYLALGDWHGTRQVDDRTWYAGTPESDRFKDNGSGQALLVTLADAGPPRVEPVRIGRYRWRAETRTLTVPSDVDVVLQWLATLGADEVLRLTLTGSVDLRGRARLEHALEQAGGRLRALDAELDALEVEPTDEDIDDLHVDGYVGEVIDALRAERSGPDAARARDALVLLAGWLEPGRDRAGNGGRVA